MADKLEGLADTYIDDLISKKISARNSIPQIEAGEAVSSIAKMTGSKPLAVMMSGLNAIGQGVAGQETRAAEQILLDQAAKQQNFENAQSYDDDLGKMFQRNTAMKNATARTEIARKGLQLETDALNVSEATKRNTAALQTTLTKELEGVREIKQANNEFLLDARNKKLVQGGLGGQAFELTEAGKKDTAFAEKFNSLPNPDDLVRAIQERTNKTMLKNLANDNKLDDTGTINVGGIAQQILATSPSTKKKALNDQAKIDAWRDAEIKKVTGGTGFNNNVFNTSQFNLTESLDQPAKDLFDEIRANAEDPTEVNRIFEDVKTNKAFYGMDDIQKKFILSKLLKDQKGVTQNKLGGISFRGDWDSTNVLKALPDYVKQFTSAQEAAGKIKDIKIAHSRRTIENTLLN